MQHNAEKIRSGTSNEAYPRELPMGFFDFLRRPKKTSPPSNGFSVEFDEAEVICRRSDGHEESVRWADLRAVLIRTTSDGPFVDDVFWVLAGEKGGCVVPSESAGVQELMERLQQLPGFDDQAVIAAMCCASDKEFLCWTCEEPRKFPEENDLPGH